MLLRFTSCATPMQGLTPVMLPCPGVAFLRRHESLLLPLKNAKAFVIGPEKRNVQITANTKKKRKKKKKS